MSQFLSSGGQRIRVSASASVLPMNIQDWIPLRVTVQGTQKSLPNTPVQKRQFCGAQLSLRSKLHGGHRDAAASATPKPPLWLPTPESRSFRCCFLPFVCTLIYSWATGPHGYIDMAFSLCGHILRLSCLIFFTTSVSMQLTTKLSHSNWYVASGLRAVKWPVPARLEWEAGRPWTPWQQPQLPLPVSSLSFPRHPRDLQATFLGPSGVRDSWSEVTVLEGGMPGLCHNNIEISKDNNTQPFLFKGEWDLFLEYIIVYDSKIHFLRDKSQNN